MDLGKGLGHLTCSTLVHPGDDWAQMWESLTTSVPKVKARIAPKDRAGVSLRLSARSAELLAGNRAERDRLRKCLGDHDMDLFTVNAFPYGPFKGPTVKEQVYEPDWRPDERTRYTIRVAEDAFVAWEKDPGPREWRTHFHVPVFLEELGVFRTTRFPIENAHRCHTAKPLSRQIEIETDTWDVLPDNLRTGDIVGYVCRELDWVRGQLA